VDCGIASVHAITVYRTMQVACNLLDHFYMYMRFLGTEIFEHIVPYKHYSCCQAALQALMEGLHDSVKYSIENCAVCISSMTTSACFQHYGELTGHHHQHVSVCVLGQYDVSLSQCIVVV